MFRGKLTADTLDEDEEQQSSTFVSGCTAVVPGQLETSDLDKNGKKKFGLQVFIIFWYHLQSCAYQFGLSLFQDSEETIHIAEINDTSYERAVCFH